jgi:tetratricopeptide (TPR) repeat protein
VISSRLDRLEQETKRVLQEASVIGRAFLYEILKRITEIREQVDRCLSGLERYDLIRTRAIEPELEYVFKHALTQEVVYNGLLKKERQEIHERIATVLEELFQDRLPEFYETLAIHFRQGRSANKAVDYLVKSAQKALGRYALEEAHQYHKEAFELLSEGSDGTKEDKRRLIDLILEWSMVYHMRAAYAELFDVLKAHEDVAKSLDDKSRLGMFYMWTGAALHQRYQAKEANQCLERALELGEETEDESVIGYACAWLSWTASTLGFLEKGVAYGERALEISKKIPSDRELFRAALQGLSSTFYIMGDLKRLKEAAQMLLDHGEKHSDIRSTGWGFENLAVAYQSSGDYALAIEFLHKAIQVSVDPWLTFDVKMFLGWSYIAAGQMDRAEETLQEVIEHSEAFGYEYFGTGAQSMRAVVLIGKGNLNQGLGILQNNMQVSLDAGLRFLYCVLQQMLGRVYLTIACGEGSRSFSFMAKNIGSLLRHVPFASKKAEYHFNKAIETAEETGCNHVAGTSYLDLGLLHKAKGRKEKAQESLSKAIKLLGQCGAEVYLKQAQEALDSLP